MKITFFTTLEVNQTHVSVYRMFAEVGNAKSWYKKKRQNHSERCSILIYPVSSTSCPTVSSEYDGYPEHQQPTATVKNRSLTATG